MRREEEREEKMRKANQGERENEDTYPKYSEENTEESQSALCKGLTFADISGELGSKQGFS